MKSVGIGLLGRDEGLLEGPKNLVGDKESCNRKSFEVEGYPFIDNGSKIGGGKWPTVGQIRQKCKETSN